VNQQEIEDIEFKILVNIEGCNIADKFNVYYIQSINNIVESIDRDAKSRDVYKKVIYVIENKEIMENFEIIRIEDLERVVIKLLKKERHGRENN